MLLIGPMSEDLKRELKAYSLKHHSRIPRAKEDLKRELKEIVGRRCIYAILNL